MLNCSESIGCPVVVLWRWMGEGALKCSLTLSPRDQPDSPMYSTGAIYLGAFIMVDNPTFVGFRILVFGVA